MEIFIYNLSLVNGLIALICSGLQLVIKKKDLINYYMSFLYFLMACLQLYFWSFGAGIIYNFPFLIYGDIAISFAIGPTFYLYLLKVSKSGGRLPLSLLNYIPTAATVCILVICYYTDDSFLHYYLANRPAFPHYSENKLIDILNMASDASIFLYLVLSMKKVYSLIKSNYNHDKRGLYIVLFFFIAVTASMSLLVYARIKKDDFIFVIVSAIIGLLVVYYFFFSYRFPEITQAEIREARASKPDSVLKGVDAEGIIGRMTELVEKDRVHRDRYISLQSFSNSLGLNAYVISIILNEKLNKNFRTYINAFRVQDAKKLLETRPQMPVIEIAFEVGFNTKSSFNKAFSLETGVSPVEYRKKNQKKHAGEKCV